MKKPTEDRAVVGCRCSPSTDWRHRRTGPDRHPRPLRPCAFSASQQPRRAPLHSYRSFPGQARPFHFPAFFIPSSTRNPHWLTKSPPYLPCEPRPSGHRIPPFLPNRSFWAASGSRARPFGRRWKGTGRGGPGTPPERSREAGTRGRGGANLLGAALPWQRGGRAEGEGGSEKEGDVVLPRPPPQLPLPACCRFFPEAAAGSCREQLQSLPYCVFP